MRIGQVDRHRDVLQRRDGHRDGIAQHLLAHRHHHRTAVVERDRERGAGSGCPRSPPPPRWPAPMSSGRSPNRLLSRIRIALPPMLVKTTLRTVVSYPVGCGDELGRRSPSPIPARSPATPQRRSSISPMWRFCVPMAIARRPVAVGDAIAIHAGRDSRTVLRPPRFRRLDGILVPPVSPRRHTKSWLGRRVFLTRQAVEGSWAGDEMVKRPYELSSQRGAVVARVRLRGSSVLSSPLLNRGTAFTLAEREALGLTGSVARLACRRWMGSCDGFTPSTVRQPDDLAKNLYLASLAGSQRGAVLPAAH